MVLNGVGGRTIAEAKSNMTTSEVKMWSSYYYKRGSLNTGRRVEQAIGNLMKVYIESKSRPGTDIPAQTFMPNEDQQLPADSIFDFDDD